MRHADSAPRSPRRLLAAALLALVAVAGCSDDPAGPGSNGDNGPSNGSPDGYNHQASVGDAAVDFLSGETYDRLVVQVHYVEGFEPTAGGRADLQAFLEARLYKPGGIVIQVEGPLPVEPQESWSPAQVRALEAEHRTAYTEGSTLAAYLLYLDGEYAQNSDVLGIAYYNTSMALFAETIAQHTDGLLPPSRADVEGTVAKHEVGHLLGLVDNGVEMQTDHHHENHGPHCENDRCLMYFAVRLGDFISQLLEGMPELDEDCLNDLQAAGGR